MLRQAVSWIAAALMLTGALMLLIGVGASGIWIAVITVGIAMVAIDVIRHRQGPHHA